MGIEQLKVTKDFKVAMVEKDIFIIVCACKESTWTIEPETNYTLNECPFCGRKYYAYVQVLTSVFVDEENLKE